MVKTKPKGRQKSVSGEEKTVVPEVPPQLEELDHGTATIEQ